MSQAPDWIQRCAGLRLGRSNLFDLVRLYAAVQVLLVHGHEHLGLNWPHWLSPALSLPDVPLFFSISGFLVGLSWLRLQPDWRVYAWHRALRIFPALWFCLFITVLVLLLAGQSSFLLSPVGGIWLAGQLTVVQFFNPSALHDLGVGVINGSLWTIPVELQFYGVLPLMLLVVTALQRRGAWRLAVTVPVALVFVSLATRLLQTRIPAESLASRLLHVSVLPHLLQFLLGLACLPLLVWLGRQRSMLVLHLLGLTCLALSRGLPATAAMMTPLACAALPIGVGLIPLEPLRGVDLSYGLYLFHMPVANALLITGALPKHQHSLYLAVSLLMAVISWFGVERPALALKSRLAR
jgi:peptidoglycan/LPS O-acetylase OafA/YrhL